MSPNSYLLYKQETICKVQVNYDKNGLLRLFLFCSDNLSIEDMTKLRSLVFYIVSVHVPLLLIIHLQPNACDGPPITLFSKNLLLAYWDTDEKVADLVF